jgi:hypothetical protein
MDIPELLKAIPQWGPWSLKKRGERLDKVPVFSTNKPEQWLPFDEALAMLKPGQQMGLCVTGLTDLIALDLDKCLDEKGRPAPWAASIITQMGSYTEVSPSGRGIRIFVQGRFDSDWQVKDGEVAMEVYSGHAGRYLTVTGDIWPGAPMAVLLPPDGVLKAFEQTYRPEQGAKSKGIALVDMPELLREVAIPDGIGPEADRFLKTGECTGDRSQAVHWAARCLREVGCTEQEVISILVENPFSLEIALDHRRQDFDKAVLYLWKHHVLATADKARGVTTLADFDVEAEPTAPLPRFQRDKAGMIDATVDNVVTAVRSIPMIGMDIRHDDFRDEIVLQTGDGQWRPFQDPDYTRLRIILERQQFKSVGRELIRDAVALVAVENRFDTAIHWLRSLAPWDGVPRISTFYSRYFGTDDTPYCRAVAEYTWSALAARVLVPGIKADMVPVWIGEQGVRKTTAISCMVPSPDLATEIDIDERREEDNARKIRGVLIAELAELKGLKTRDSEYVKAFITRTHERWIQKYREFATTFARRLIYIGTTNEPEFLADETGNRRWLPLMVNGVDTDGIISDRDQLWAEAVVYFEKHGIAFKNAEILAKDVHSAHMLSDSWAEDIQIWLSTPHDLTGEIPGDSDFIAATDIAKYALKIEVSRKDARANARIIRAMRDCGWASTRRRVDGNYPRGFTKV